MQTLLNRSIRSGLAAAAFVAAALLTSGTAQAEDYCDFPDGYVYCGVVENIVEGDPALPDCVSRWERASRDCPPGE